MDFLSWFPKRILGELKTGIWFTFEFPHAESYLDSVGRQSFTQYITLYVRVKGCLLIFDQWTCAYVIPPQKQEFKFMSSITEDHSWWQVFSYSHATPAINFSPPAIFFYHRCQLHRRKTVGRISVSHTLKLMVGKNLSISVYCNPIASKKIWKNLLIYRQGHWHRWLIFTYEYIREFLF